MGVRGRGGGGRRHGAGRAGANDCRLSAKTMRGGKEAGGRGGREYAKFGSQGRVRCGVARGAWGVGGWGRKATRR